MKDKTFLMIPGPTPVPESVMLEIAKHPIGHRSSEFSSILKEVYENLKYVFQTKNDVFMFTSSGTGAMCAALENLVNEGDNVLCLSLGNFGNRWAKIAESRGAVVEKIEVEAGGVIEPEVLRKKLGEDKDKKIILVSGSQKGFMIPPGLAFLTANERAWKVYENCKHPSFYFNWGAHKKAIDGDTTPFTPAVNLIVGLNQALKMIKEEGIENMNARHKRHAMALRRALRAINLELLVKEDKNASWSITSILPPEGISVPDIRAGMKKDFDIVVANGQNQLKDKIFRMGTLGFVSDRDLIMAVGSLEGVLYKLGHKFELGAGVRTVIQALGEGV